MVPQDQVYDDPHRAQRRGPAQRQRRRRLLDPRQRRTSPPREFQEQTDFKRAMEGELSKTIEAIDGVDTAIVHLALPEKQVFADEQAPATASVLVDTAPGTTLGPEQVQADRAPGRLQHRRPRPREGHRGRLERQGAVDQRRHRRRRRQHPRPSRSRTTRTEHARPGPGDARPRRRPGQLDRPGHRRPRLRQGRHRDDAPTPPTRTSRRCRRATSTETYTGPAGRRRRRRRRRRPRRPDGQRRCAGTRRLELREAVGDHATTPVDSVTEHRESAPGAVQSLHVGVVARHRGRPRTSTRARSRT